MRDIYTTTTPQRNKVFVLSTGYKKQDICSGIEGEKFTKLIEVCFEEASYFSLTKASIAGRSFYPCMLEDMLEPFKVKELSPAHWFAYHGFDKITVMIYKAIPQTMDIVLSCFQDIFLINRKNVPKKKYEQIGHIYKYPSFLEDICFFTKHELFFGTLSHECICAAVGLHEHFEQSLHEIASWYEVSPELFEMDKIRI